MLQDHRILLELGEILFGIKKHCLQIYKANIEDTRRIKWEANCLNKDEFHHKIIELNRSPKMLRLEV